MIKDNFEWNINLGKLIEMDVEDIWGQSQILADWLSKKENIQVLGNEVGIEFTGNVTKQYYANSFSLIAENKDASKTMVHILLDYSSHEYFGQVIYRVSKLQNIAAIICLVKKARIEHKHTIRWLNKNINDISFSLVEIHAYKINGSLPALKFQALERPNSFYSKLPPKEISEEKEDIEAYKAFLA